MNNLHYVIHELPAIEKKLKRKFEKIAIRLARSGRMRIDAIDRRNFVKMPVTGLDQMFTFSHREIKDNNLFEKKIARVRYVLGQKYKGEALDKRTSELAEYVKKEAAKQLPVAEETEIKLARLIMQSCHPVLPLLMLEEGTEIFISYEHYIGDMLDMEGWRSHGSNSGMQATNSLQSAVYISCGGDPLIGSKEVKYEGDGINAASRFMVIAAQEIGHYADMIRGGGGRYIARHSADINGTRATEKTRIAREKDIERLTKIEKFLIKSGLERVAELERGVFFLKKHRKISRRFFFSWLWARFRLYLMILKIESYNLHAIANIKAYSKYFEDLRGRRTSAIKIQNFINDMKVNLTPKADVYKRENPEEEEAIACIEALARMPQQVVKWGYAAVRLVSPRLLSIYYKDVLKDCLKAYESSSGHKFKI